MRVSASERNPATAIQRDVVATLWRPGLGYWALLALSIGAVIFGVVSYRRMYLTGFGVTGLKHPIMWGMMIASFVFWVGIAHSGTLISAVLFLFRARFRTAVYRSAEAMTVFAVMTAGLFPVLHLGRSWLAFWVFPIPNDRQLWVNFRSPLVWDVFAISTYFTVSSLFLFTGLIPDIAAIRDSAKGLKRKIYGILSLGWRGGDGEWRRYGRGYLFFAAMATPLVISVHSVVSWDFAMSLVPGWHSTIFAPYFVAGAILSGVAMVITILIPLRRFYRLEEYITTEHFDMLSRLLIFTSLIVTYAYGMEFFLAFFGPNAAEKSLFVYRATGPYAPLFWLMVACNCVVPALCFVRKLRRDLKILFVFSLLVNVGMFLERFIIVATSLSHTYDPSSWTTYRPRLVEIGLFVGSFGWFMTWFLIFLKLFPAVSLAEMKEHAAAPHAETKEVGPSHGVAHA